jgi:3-phytase
VDISGATDVSGKANVNGRTAEQASESDMKKASVQYVKKTMAVDLAKLGFSPDKFEGLALVDPTTIAVVNDNDFGVTAIDTKGNVVKSGAMPRLVVIRVPQPIQ